MPGRRDLPLTAHCAEFGVMSQFNRTAKAAAAPGGGFSTAKTALLARSVREACDAQDGVSDGIVSNPQACNHDPGVLRCAGGADTGDTCLSDAQLAVVQSWTSPASLVNGMHTNPGWALSGNEDDPGAWNAWVTQGAAPGTLQASKQANGATVLSRPLCRYPDYPRYTGPVNDAAATMLATNYTCTAP